MKSTRTKIGAMLAKPAFNSVRQMLDPAEIGSAPLLGINELIFVGHGRSDAKAMVSAISRAVQAIDTNLLPGLKNTISKNGE
jgi:glycerol-3-phosphate acyltransferase PlsX